MARTTEIPDPSPAEHRAYLDLQAALLELAAHIHHRKSGQRLASDSFSLSKRTLAMLRPVLESAALDARLSEPLPLPIPLLHPPGVSHVTRPHAPSA